MLKVFKSLCIMVDVQLIYVECTEKPAHAKTPYWWRKRTCKGFHWDILAKKSSWLLWCLTTIPVLGINRNCENIIIKVRMLKVFKSLCIMVDVQLIYVEKPAHAKSPYWIYKCRKRHIKDSVKAYQWRSLADYCTTMIIDLALTNYAIVTTVVGEW